MKKTVATNRRARHDYTILDTYEAGLVLKGSEVKSLRTGNAHLKDGYAHIRGGEAFLAGIHIAPYAFSHGGGHSPDRERKLLLHAREIEKLRVAIEEKGLTIVPLHLYFRDGKAKIELGVGRGRRSYDKRRALRERQEKREMEREIRRR